jgi:DNA-binding transcriptional ArsR family regulator
MPILGESQQTVGIQIKPSAVLELMWVVHFAEAEHVLSGPFEPLERVRLDLGPALRSFWDDGVRGFTEVVVLAARSGTLVDLDLNHFFARFDAAADVKGDRVSMLSETPDERIALTRRLKRLRTDLELRARYKALLNSAWEPVRGEWDSTGRQAVLAAAEDWKRRLRDGGGYRDLLERTRLWGGRPELDDLADAAAADGHIVISPGWFFGKIHVVELDGVIYLGRGVNTRGDEASHREVAASVAGTLKVLADPTRLSILLFLACEPASVTELARHLSLSQPTISAHVRLLREAGLLEERSAGRSAKLIARQENLKRVFASAEQSLLKVFHGE